MSDNLPSRPRFHVNTGPLITGAVLMGVGGVLALAGAALAGSTLAAAARRRIREMDVPPSELARQQLARARAATTAGVSAWRNGQPTGQRERA